jgi:hypothetical protein
MKFKDEENALIWKSFRNKIINERFDDDDDIDMMGDDDFGDDDFGDDEFDDDDDFGAMSDDPDFGVRGFDSGSPSGQNMVMEIEPVASVEKHEVNEVLVSELKKLAEYAERLYDMKDQCEFDDWMVSAITIASTYVSDVWHRLDAKADFANTGFEQSKDFNNF